MRNRVIAGKIEENNIKILSRREKSPPEVVVMSHNIWSTQK